MTDEQKVCLYFNVRQTMKRRARTDHKWAQARYLFEQCLREERKRANAVIRMRRAEAEINIA